MSLSPMFTFAAVAFLATVAAQGNAVDQGVQSITPAEDIVAHPIYEFVYEVGPRGASGDFGHTEARDGGRTWGSYFQKLPDGRLQTVKYWADDSGYHAEIEYAGNAKPWTGQEEGGGGTQESPRFAALLESFPAESQTTTTPRTAQRSDDYRRPKPFASRRSQDEQGRNEGSDEGQQALRAIPIQIYSKRKEGKAT